jgi:hypothetical protein
MMDRMALSWPSAHEKSRLLTQLLEQYSPRDAPETSLSTLGLDFEDTAQPSIADTTIDDIFNQYIDPSVLISLGHQSPVRQSDTAGPIF